jgi:hypothetical protein
MDNLFVGIIIPPTTVDPGGNGRSWLQMIPNGSVYLILQLSARNFTKGYVNETPGLVSNKKRRFSKYVGSIVLPESKQQIYFPWDLEIPKFRTSAFPLSLRIRTWTPSCLCASWLSVCIVEMLVNL